MAEPAAVAIYGIKACDTMKKARAWLEANGVAYVFHDYKVEGIAADRLAAWADKAGWEVLLNRSGTTFRKLPEADRVDIDRDRALTLMAAQPSMIKRPIVEYDGGLLIGFKAPEWAAALG